MDAVPRSNELGHRARLDRNRIRPSMNRKGTAGTTPSPRASSRPLAFELELDARWHDVHEVERDLTEYYRRFHNSQGKHLYNRYLSPMAVVLH
jgi:hypothetical protein